MRNSKQTEMVKALAELQEEIGKKITDTRREIGMTQSDLSQASGISQGRLSRVERGQCNITIETLLTIAHAMDKELDVFFK